MKITAEKKAKISDLSREQWLRLRKESLGGSDAATVLALNPFRSKLELYCEKKGILPEKETTEAMRLGTDLEEYVARRFTEATGKRVRRSGYMWQHPKHQFMTANVDREIVGENAILECKTTSPFNKTDFDGGNVPLNYYVQCMHYLSVLGCDRAYLAVLVYGKGFYWYAIDRDETEIESLEEAERSFWEGYIQADIPPLADGSEGSMEALSRLYAHDNTDMTADLSGYNEDVNRYLEINKLLKKLDDEKDEIKGRLASALGGCALGRCDDATVSNMRRSRAFVDTVQLQKDYPEVYKAVAKQSTYTMFKITERKKQV